MDNVTDFQFYHRQGYKYDPKKEVPLPSLKDKIKDKPLERGIGHDGWIGIHVKQASQREMNNKPTLDVWVVDAYGNKHPVHLRSRNDERKWGYVVRHCGVRVAIIQDGTRVSWRNIAIP